jgi:hypothetical protein
MIRSTIKGFGAAAAVVLVLVIAAPGESRAGYRIAGHPAHVNALKLLRTGTAVAAPAAQAPPPQIAPARRAASDSADEGRDRNASAAGVTAGVIVAGMPTGYYYGPATYYAPGYYGGQYSDGGPAVGPSPLGDDDAAACPQSGTYIGDDGNPRPCP